MGLVRVRVTVRVFFLSHTPKYLKITKVTNISIRKIATSVSYRFKINLDRNNGGNIGRSAWPGWSTQERPVLATAPTQFNAIKLSEEFFTKTKAQEKRKIAIFTGVRVKKRKVIMPQGPYTFREIMYICSTKSCIEID